MQIIKISYEVRDCRMECRLTRESNCVTEYDTASLKMGGQCCPEYLWAQEEPGRLKIRDTVLAYCTQVMKLFLRGVCSGTSQVTKGKAEDEQCGILRVHKTSV